MEESTLDTPLQRVWRRGWLSQGDITVSDTAMPIFWRFWAMPTIYPPAADDGEVAGLVSDRLHFPPLAGG